MAAFVQHWVERITEDLREEIYFPAPSPPQVWSHSVLHRRRRLLTRLASPALAAPSMALLVAVGGTGAGTKIGAKMAHLAIAPVINRST